MTEWSVSTIGVACVDDRVKDVDNRVKAVDDKIAVNDGAEYIFYPSS
jgi:hypothetical protein